MDLPTLRDDDLVLRPKVPEDADALVEACQDPEIPRWTMVPSPYGRADAEAFIASSAREAAAGAAANLVAVDAADGRLLGSFSVMEIERESAYGEIGYWVTADARGRGVATRGVRRLVRWAREELGLARLEILAHRDNVPSRRVAEKAGFHDTGELRSAPRGGEADAVYAVYRLGA